MIVLNRSWGKSRVKQRMFNYFNLGEEPGSKNMSQSFSPDFFILFFPFEGTGL